jgi:hypothetical protein
MYLEANKETSGESDIPKPFGGIPSPKDIGSLLVLGRCKMRIKHMSNRGKRCSVPFCRGRARVKGMCQNHYNMSLKRGYRIWID